MAGKKWEQWEDEVLKDSWKILNDEEIGIKLDRSKSSVSNRRKTLDLRKTHNEWTEEECNYLLEAYANGTEKEIILSKLKGRTWGAIQKYATLKKVKRVIPNQLLDEEVEFIKNNYERLSDKEIGLILNREEHIIKNKRNQLKLTNVNVFLKDSEEYRFLKENFRNMDDKELAKHFKITEKQVGDKRRNFGFIRVENSGVYSKEEIENLYKYFPNKTVDELLEIFPNRSWSSINTKGTSLKIKRNMYSAFWTKEKDDYIKNNFGIKTDEEISLYLGISRREVGNRRREHLGLVYESREWTKEEESFIKNNSSKHYSFESFRENFISKFGYIDKTELKTKGYKLGFKLIETQYSEEENKILSEMWFYNGFNEILKEVNKVSKVTRTENSIKGQANRIGISSRENYLKYKKEMILNECRKEKWELIESSLDNYINSRSKIQFRCIDCERLITVTLSDYRNNTKRCYNCIISKTCDSLSLDLNEVSDKIKQIHKNRIQILSTEYKRNTDKGKFKCAIDGHIWSTKWAHILTGHGCPKCRDRGNAEKSRLSLEEIKLRLKEVNSDIELISEEYINNNKPLKWKCKKCGKTFYKAWNNILNGQGCTRCNDKKYKGEYKVQLFLEDFGIDFKKQKMFKTCVNPITNRRLKFDFYLNSTNILIEFDGEGHSMPIDFAGRGEEWAKNQLKKGQARDAIKNKWCKENGYKLIRISYLDYSNIESILLKELRNIL